MTPERTPEGLEARLKPRGFGRFISAVFLLVWLCGWAAGECFALWLLIKGGLGFLSGNPPLNGSQPMTAGFALMIGLFLLLWLSFWTLGGYLAGREFLRLLWSEDRIVARSDALVLHRRIGPFRSTRTIQRSDLLRVHATPKCRLVAETAAGSVELTSLARGPECQALASVFQQEMGLKADELRQDVSLPERWSEVADAEGGIALVENEPQRRARGRIAWGLTALAASLTLALVALSKDRPDQLSMAVVLGAISALLAWYSWRTTHTRLEWRLEPGRLRLRRRSSRWMKDLFEGSSLELVETSDSDGDRWFTLYAVAAGAPQLETAPLPWDRKHRRKLEHVMDDSSAPRRLGAWLARRAGLRLEDRTTAEHKKQDLAALIAKLESGGRFSRWMAKHIPRP